MANTEGYRLVRCPKCFNVLPEPANVTVYKCGGCGTTLRAKIRTSSGRHVAAKQVRQDSDNYSVATSVSNGVRPQNKDEEAPAGSCIANASSTEHNSNGTSSNENCDVQPTEKNAVEVESTEEEKEHQIFEGQNASSSEEGPADLAHISGNGTPLDSDKAENHAVEPRVDNSEASKEREIDGSECRLNVSENNVLNSERNKVTVNVQDSEDNGEDETDHTVNKKSYLVRVQSRSCDLRASINSLDFHSARTSIQSKSFRASEPLQSKIMNSVDELKGDLSELFGKPSDCKPRAAYPPRPKQDSSFKPRAATTSSEPLAAYHPAARHSGHANRLSRSGQVAPRGLPSPRYRRRRAYSGYPIEHMEMRPCRHECCHSCRPPCYRSCNQEPAMHKPPVKEVKRRPPPRHHCRPVLRGSPFVICSNCLNLVQLPTDFTVPSKGTRRLRCGSCSELLSYSYKDPSRKKLQSPFGGDEYSTDDYEIHQAADDHHNAGFGQVEPVSYSEEYGLSFGVSYSTSTEDGQPLYVSRNSSFNTVDGRVSRDGKLHLLMGYSSASELLRHSPDLFESFDGRTPDARTLDRKGKGVCDDNSGEQDAAVKKSKVRSGGLPLQGILKKGIHGLESLKLRS